MANRYWVGGTGTWDSSSTTHWSDTSGGASGFSDPSSGDTVYFDANSGGGTVTPNYNIVVAQLYMGSFTGTLDWSVNNNNFTTLNGFHCSGTGNRTLKLGSGTFSIGAGNGYAWDMSVGTNLTFDGGTATIKYTSAGSQNYGFRSSGQTFYKLWWNRGASTGARIHEGDATFYELRDSGTAAHSLLFDDGTTHHFTNFIVENGTAEVKISSWSTGTTRHYLIKDGGGSVSCDYLNIQHSVATPATTWYAGTHSTNNQGVSTTGSGWIFTEPSPSPSLSPSSSASPSSSISASRSPSSSRSPSTSASPSRSPSSSISASVSPSASTSPSNSASRSQSPSTSVSLSRSPSSSISSSPSPSLPPGFSSSSSISPSSSMSPSASVSLSQSPSSSTSSSTSPSSSSSQSQSPSSSESPSISPSSSESSSTSPSSSESQSQSPSSSTSSSVSPSPSAVIPKGNPSIVTVASRVQQSVSFPKFILGGKGGPAGDSYGLFKQSSNYGTHVWRSEVIQIGRDFDIIQIRFPIVTAIGADMNIIPVLYFDNETLVSVGNQINSTLYPNGNTYIRLSPKNFDNGVHGRSNFFIEFRWLGTELVTVGLPITFKLEIEDE